jgi:hypothetical protein
MAEDLERNRAVFEGMAGRAAVMPHVPDVTPHQTAGRTIFAPTAMPVRIVEEPVEEMQPKRIVYSLGAPPENGGRWNPVIETALTYPEPRKERAAEKSEVGAFSDDAYQSLLRRFDADARQESQLVAEEGML